MESRESGAAHQVSVGEVERGVEHEVGLDDPAGLLADVVEEPGALQWDTALIAILEGFEDRGSFKSLIWSMGRGFAPIAISSQHDPTGHSVKLPALLL